MKPAVGLLAYAVVVIAFLYAPLLLIPLFSFNDSLFAVFPLKGFTVRHYAEMAGNAGLLSSLANSLVVGLSSSVIATLIAIAAALSLTRHRLPGQNIVFAGMLLPLIVPAIVFAVAMLVLFTRIFGIPLSLWTIGAGHVLVCLPFAVMVMMASLEGFDPTLEEASRDLGEGPWQTFRRITLPLSMPGIISSLLLCFITSFDEFVMAFFLGGVETTLPVYLFSQLRFPTKLPGVLALGSLVLILSAIIVVIAERIRIRASHDGNPS